MPLGTGSRAAAIYQTTEISERHRHRYEFNTEYEPHLARLGLRVVGRSPDGRFVEMVERDDHPWFIGCQFHPEYKSRPYMPHPLFVSFVAAARRYRVENEVRQQTTTGKHPVALLTTNSERAGIAGQATSGG